MEHKFDLILSLILLLCKQNILADCIIADLNHFCTDAVILCSWEVTVSYSSV